jgi:hypothetical protein
MCSPCLQVEEKPQKARSTGHSGSYRCLSIVCGDERIAVVYWKNADLLLKTDTYRHPESLDFWTLPIVRNCKYKKTQHFGNWICFRPQTRGDTPTLLGPLERELQSLNDQTQVSLHPFIWGRKQIQFLKRCVFLYLEFRTMDRNPVILCVIHHRQNP